MDVAAPPRVSTAAASAIGQHTRAGSGKGLPVCDSIAALTVDADILDVDLLAHADALLGSASLAGAAVARLRAHGRRRTAATLPSKVGADELGILKHNVDKAVVGCAPLLDIVRLESAKAFFTW